MIENISQMAELVTALAKERGTPAAGTVAGVVSSMAASLVAAVADDSRQEWVDAAGAAAQARALSKRSLTLAEELAEAYDAARTALGAAGDTQDTEHAQRDSELGRIVAAAAEPPLALAACASDIAKLAAVVADRAVVDLRASAVIAAKLAAAAADAAAHLVAINLVAGADEELVGRALTSAKVAADAARAASAG